MELQIALDRLSLDAAVKVTAVTAQYADWIEVGTSMVKAHGMDGVSRIIDAAQGCPVMVDTKTMDDGLTEMTLCATAGAHGASVMAVAELHTLDACVEATRQLGCELLVDLMACSSRRREKLVAAYADQPHLIWALHVGTDGQARGNPVDQLRDEAREWSAHHPRLAVAGGLNERTAPALARYVHRVIVGSAITSSGDPARAADRMREALRARKGA